MKKVELKRRAEAVATQRHELIVPLMQHRRFSETVAIDHRAKPHEMQVRRRQSGASHARAHALRECVRLLTLSFTLGS